MCLSLLGTFSGPAWEPGKSTIYQLMLSIQSLVLNKWPLGACTRALLVAGMGFIFTHFPLPLPHTHTTQRMSHAMMAAAPQQRAAAGPLPTMQRCASQS